MQYFFRTVTTLYHFFDCIAHNTGRFTDTDADAAGRHRIMYNADPQFLRVCLEYLICIVKLFIHTVCDIVYKTIQKSFCNLCLRLFCSVFAFLQIRDPKRVPIVIDIRHIRLPDKFPEDAKLFLCRFKYKISHKSLLFSPFPFTARQVIPTGQYFCGA